MFYNKKRKNRNFGINLSEEEYKEIIYKILEYNEELNILQGVKNGQYKNTK